MMDEVPVGRRTFLKTMAFMAGAIAAGPAVLDALGDTVRAAAIKTPLLAPLSGVPAESDTISYADFCNAVAYLEQHNAPGPYVMVMPPWLYAGLMESWDEFLREEFGMSQRMILREISPGRAEYVDVDTGKSLGILIVYSEAIPEDDTLISWKVISENATLTIGIEA